MVEKTRHGFCPHGAHGLQAKPATKGRRTELGLQLPPWLTGCWGSVPGGRPEDLPWEVTTEGRQEGEVERAWARGGGNSPAWGRACAKMPQCQKQGTLKEASVGRGGRRVRRAEVGEGPAHQVGLVFFLSAAGVALRTEPGGSGQICVGKGHLRFRVEDKLLARVVAEDQ